jgi:diguanylate cyclase (GGDEF)-like protein
MAVPAVVVLAWLAFCAHTLGAGGDRLDALFDVWIYNGVILAAAVACLLRARVSRSWALMGVALVLWSAGELVFSLAYPKDEVPIPSAADPLYLCFYPLSYAALMLLVRDRGVRLPRGTWLDGAIAALAAAAFAAAFTIEPVTSDLGASVPEVAVNLAYPLGDLLLLGLVAGAFALTGWRPGRAWLLIGCGLVCNALADSTYLVQSAHGTYSEGGPVDALWPASALLIGFAAWARPAAGGSSFDGRRVIAVPLASGLMALGLGTLAAFGHVSHVAGGLASATMLLVTVRMAIAYAENQQMLRESRHEAQTDPLTQLANRRRLLRDLEDALVQSDPARPTLLILMDLNGFKVYNDTFGHPAGDALLIRLGQRLAAATAGYGRAYRLGGDEFCVLAQPGATATDAVTTACRTAMTERGDAFSVDAAHGTAMLPAEAHDVSDALRLADRRLYVNKNAGRPSILLQARDVLLTSLAERQPELCIHLYDVAALALAVARDLGITGEEVDEIGRAAELHDVGKIAIPDAILHKPGPLDEAEWEFMRRHTLMGERILNAAPALRPVAKIVRSSHERWDGGGYPDSLAREDIPLGARIVAVCDAYDAMVSERSYVEAVTHDEALAELERCAGTQFDPAVVASFRRVAPNGSAPYLHLQDGSP